MRKTALVSFIILIFIIIGLGGCKSASDRAFLSDAKVRAVEYIQEKYTINARAVKSEIALNEDGTTAGAFVNLRSDKTYFYAFVDVNNACYDNYQMSEIKAGISSMVADLMGTRTIGEFFWYGKGIEYSASEDTNGLVQTFYTGDNLRDVVCESPRRFVLEYSEEVNTAKVRTLDTLNDYSDNGRLLFVAYRDQDATGKVSGHDFGILDGSVEDEVYYNFMYINNAAQVADGTCKYYSAEIKQAGNLYYVSPGSYSYCNILDTGSKDKPRTWNTKEQKYRKALTNTFSVNADAYKIYIYWPKSALGKKFDPSKAAIGESYTKGTDQIFSVSGPVEDSGDYYSFKLMPGAAAGRKDYKFTIIN